MTVAPERLPSRPLRNWLLAWHIHTGDPGDVIAKGFDLDPILVADLLSGGRPLMIERGEALAICIRLRRCARGALVADGCDAIDWPTMSMRPRQRFRTASCGRSATSADRER